MSFLVSVLSWILLKILERTNFSDNLWVIGRSYYNYVFFYMMKMKSVGCLISHGLNPDIRESFWCPRALYQIRIPDIVLGYGIKCWLQNPNKELLLLLFYKWVLTLNMCYQLKISSLKTYAMDIFSTYNKYANKRLFAVEWPIQW